MTRNIVLITIFLLSIFSCSIYAKKSDTERAGDVLQILIPTTVLTSTLVYEKGHIGTIQFFKSLASSQIITEGLKLSVNKKRPNGTDNKSFPSGHTAAAFMGASFIHKRYGFKYSIPAYIGSTFVGYSRVHADKHFTEDVIAGGIIGITSSFYFTEPYKGLIISPIAGNGFYGINVSKNW